jgi:hypothetical protein
MKDLSMLTLSALFLGQVAWTEIEIPKSVYSFSDLAKAQADAASQQKPLVFVITDAGTS